MSFTESRMYSSAVEELQNLKKNPQEVLPTTRTLLPELSVFRAASTTTGQICSTKLETCDSSTWK